MKVKVIQFFVVLAFAKAILSCTSTTKLEEEISTIPVDVELVKFHEEFAQAEAGDLQVLKEKFPKFFPKRIPDSLWIAKMTGKDSIQSILEQEVDRAGFDYEEIENEVEDVMRHVVYYFPDFEPTPIVTVISDVNYRQQVIPTSEELIISIDTYLGKDHKLYQGINKYQRDNLNRSQLPADVGMGYARMFVPPTMDRTFLGSMVYYGKLHYLQSLFAPKETGDELFNFAPKKYEFTVQNESQMWRYFIDNELLYDTNTALVSRFLSPAPFSKFYLEVDQQTPGGVGRYIGYRIVDEFMKNNQVDIETMIALDAAMLFNKSKYKPLQ